MQPGSELAPEVLTVLVDCILCKSPMSVGNAAKGPYCNPDKLAAPAPLGNASGTAAGAEALASGLSACVAADAAAALQYLPQYPLGLPFHVGFVHPDRIH